jgi:hypothetical protein
MFLMNRQLNIEKSWLFKGKTTKSSTTFRRNKPNSPIVQINASLFITTNYVNFTSLTKVKNKPNSNPITCPFVQSALYSLWGQSTKVKE